MAAAVVTGGLAAAGPASAAPKETPIRGLTIYNSTLATFGDHDFCRGTVAARFTSPKRGITRLTLTSNGFIGNGAGWKKNPTCRVLVIASQTSATALYRDIFIPAAFGAKRGQTVTRDIRTGSGLAQLAVAPYAANNPVRVPQGSGFTAYLLVP
ncbi:enoyl-CoA hydratase [Williamsia sp.]|uniref:enoyl-CoA hydratase n=1 Tax=Williamsia sp. TaxID=1872085 RepID=UPI0025D4FF6B|nr:enoyl-CoA hydratase [Williamsia sp.]